MREKERERWGGEEGRALCRALKLQSTLRAEGEPLNASSGLTTCPQVRGVPERVGGCYSPLSPVIYYGYGGVRELGSSRRLMVSKPRERKRERERERERKKKTEK